MVSWLNCSFKFWINSISLEQFPWVHDSCSIPSEYTNSPLGVGANLSTSIWMEMGLKSFGKLCQLQGFDGCRSGPEYHDPLRTDGWVVLYGNVPIALYIFKDTTSPPYQSLILFVYFLFRPCPHTGGCVRVWCSFWVFSLRRSTS